MPGNAASSRLHSQSMDPLYKQIERDILHCLAQGEWKPGAQLPVESALAKRFGVAIYTVRAGIGALVTAGILTRKQGKGTFVVRHERDRARQVFAKIFDDENHKPIPTKETVTFFEKQRADEGARRLLCLDQREQSHVYRWEAVVEVEERAFCIRHITVPAGLFPGISARVLRANRQNLYALYQELCGVNIIRLEDRVRAIKADARSAKLLGVKRGDPLLKIDRIAFTYNETPVELRTRVYDSARFHYCADLPGV